MDSLSEREDRTSAQPAGWRAYSHLIGALLFGGMAIGLVALASWLLNEPPAVFTREPQQVLDGSFYVGSFSNLGGVIWFAAAAILSFAAAFKPPLRGALILAALLTWAMGLNDIFMLHDRVYSKILPEELMLYALYFGIIGLIVLRYFRRLERSTLVGIALTVFFWVLSAALDELFNQVGGQLAEDGIKFLGIAVWAAAWIRQSYHEIRGLARPGS